jgi:hypothetical protein
LTKALPKATQTKGNQFTDKWKNDNGVEIPKLKTDPKTQGHLNC